MPWKVRGKEEIHSPFHWALPITYHIPRGGPDNLSVKYNLKAIVLDYNPPIPRLEWGILLIHLCLFFLALYSIRALALPCYCPVGTMIFYLTEY